MKLRIEPEAKEEIRSAAGWYNSKLAGLGVDFTDAVDEAVMRIFAMPLAFPRYEMLPKETTVRRYRLDRFPYLVIYQVLEDEIRVIAIHHGSRRPNYWLRTRKLR